MLFKNRSLVMVVVIAISGTFGVPSDNKPFDGGQIPPNYFFKERDLDHEICEGETFQASCNANEVVVIQSATYGRMTRGRCLPSFDTANIGCHADVRSSADSICSGKRACTIKMPNTVIVGHIPCPGELRSYFEVRYTCQKVLLLERGQCYLPLTVSISRDMTTISSSVVTENGCEVLNLQADAGQILQISIVDFMADASNAECSVKYGEIISTQADREEKTSICKGTVRERSLLETDSSVAQVLLYRDIVRSGNHFLLQAKALGCQDINPPIGTWMRREKDKMIIGCHGNEGQTWHLTCQNNRWAGVIGNCTKNTATVVETHTTDEQEDGHFPFTENFLIVTIACSSVLVATVIVTIGVVVIKRLSIKEKHKRASESYGMTGIRFGNVTNNTLKSDHTYAVYDRIPYNANDSATNALVDMGFEPRV